MMLRCLQIFSAVLMVMTAASAQTAPLTPGNNYRLSFRDVDGNDLSTAGGHVTIITVVTRQNEEQARAVAGLVPDRYIGDPKFRYVTLVNFQRKISPAFRGFINGIIRRRLEGEAKELKPRYQAKQLTRDPRRDVFVIADFDGGAVGQLGLSPQHADVEVFVFNRRGRLVQRWTGVPPEDRFVAAIATAE
jgi:hypothetical protein